MKLRPNSFQSPRLNGAPLQGSRTPPTTKQILVPERSAALDDPRSQAISNDLTTDELISRAKLNIGSGESSRTASFRAAADDIALACSREGMTQSKAAEGVGKSRAWVNRLLKWREGGYVGAPFADKIVQGVNKQPAAPQTPLIEPASSAVLAEINAIALSDQVAANAEAATAPATTTSAALPSVDYHLPAELNRQDPERAFQRLAEQWSSIPFHALFLDSPQRAQLRFLCDVVLPEVGGPEALKLFLADDGSVR